jgi:hypothetical protein
MNLCDRVRANVLYFLEAKGMTYGDLGFDRRYVGHMLAGDKGFSVARIADFAAALHVDVSELTVMRPEFKEARKP